MCCLGRVAFVRQEGFDDPVIGSSSWIGFGFGFGLVGVGVGVCSDCGCSDTCGSFSFSLLLWSLLLWMIGPVRCVVSQSEAQLLASYPSPHHLPGHLRGLCFHDPFQHHHRQP